MTGNGPRIGCVQLSLPEWIVWRVQWPTRTKSTLVDGLNPVDESGVVSGGGGGLTRKRGLFFLRLSLSDMTFISQIGNPTARSATLRQ